MIIKGIRTDNELVHSMVCDLLAQFATLQSGIFDELERPPTDHEVAVACLTVALIMRNEATDKTLWLDYLIEALKQIDTTEQSKRSGY